MLLPPQREMSMVPESNDITRAVPLAAESLSGGAPDAPPPAPAAPAAAAHDEHPGNGSTTGEAPDSASAPPADVQTSSGSPPAEDESPVGAPGEHPKGWDSAASSPVGEIG